MLTPHDGASQALDGPLTHSACLAAGIKLKQCHSPHARPWVQVRRFVKGGDYLLLCGQVLELAGEAAEWFKVDTPDGTVWAEGRNVRLCSGDGRCICEPPPVGLSRKGVPC